MKISNYSLVGRIGSSLDENQRVDVRICEGFYVPGILGSRPTDTSLIPLHIVQEAMRNDPSIMIERLKEPTYSTPTG